MQPTMHSTVLNAVRVRKGTAKFFLVANAGALVLCGSIYAANLPLIHAAKVFLTSATACFLVSVTIAFVSFRKYERAELSMNAFSPDEYMGFDEPAKLLLTQTATTFGKKYESWIINIFGLGLGLIFLLGLAMMWSTP